MAQCTVARVHGCCTLPRTLLVDYVEHTPTKSYHGICVSDMGRSMNVWHSEHTNTFLAQNKTPEQQIWCTRLVQSGELHCCWGGPELCITQPSTAQVLFFFVLYGPRFLGALGAPPPQPCQSRA